MIIYSLINVYMIIYLIIYPLINVYMIIYVIICSFIIIGSSQTQLSAAILS